MISDHQKARGLLARGERWFAVLAIIWLLRALDGPLYHEDWIPGRGIGEIAGTAIPAGFMIATTLLLARDWRAVLARARDAILLFGVVAIALVSFLWSEVPGTSVRGAVALLGTTGFGVLLAHRFTLDDQIELLGWALAWTVLVSGAAIYLFPQYALMTNESHYGQWAGTFSHKNTLGGAMGLGCIVFSTLLLNQRRPVAPAILGLLGCGALLLGSASRSALIATMASLAVVAIALRWRSIRAHWAPWAVVAGISLGIGAVALVFFGEVLLAQIGRDATLTGRTEMWQRMGSAMREQPWLGYGYGAFWSDTVHRLILFPDWNRPPVHGHNGYIDLVAELGVLGAGALALSAAYVVKRGATSKSTSTASARLWTPAFLTYVFLINLTGSMLVRHHRVFWPLLIAVGLFWVAPRDRATPPTSPR